MSGETSATIAFGILAAIVLLLGTRRGFFEFPAQDWIVGVRLFHVIGAFAVYFLAAYFCSAVAIQILKKQITTHFLLYSSWINFAISLLIFLFLLIYWRMINPLVRHGIVKGGGERSFKEDAQTAVTAWVLSFPLVLFLSQALELFLTKVFNVTQVPDQIAVKFLKSTFDTPLFFVLAVISIVILAPLIEETLFRGFLQSYIRQHLGRRQAIVITSVCFSFFHYSAGQGISNISIIFSLFVLSLFLGFVYEKQRSLFASMALHSCFNLVSVVNLYLFGGFTTGL
jgi:hypothetical protein